MDFKEYYKAPFKESSNGLYVIGDNGIKVFTALTEKSREIARRITSLLNGEKAPKFKKSEVNIVQNSLHINHEFIMIRGWGRLIGNGGGFGLSTKDAAKIQDEFVKWVIDTITEDD